MDWGRIDDGGGKGLEGCDGGCFGWLSEVGLVGCRD